MAATRLLVATQDRDLLVSLLIFLREEVSLHVVGTASDRSSLLALIGSTHPDIVLVDELLIAGQHTELAQALALPESRPRLLVMAVDEHSSIPAALTDAVVFKYAAPAVLLDRLKQVQD